MKRINSENNVKRAALLLAGALALAGCGNTTVQSSSTQQAAESGSSQESVQGNENYELLTREVFAMDTYMSVNAWGEDAEAALDEAEEEILRLDALLAAESEDSEIAGLNRDGGGKITDDTAYLIERSLELHDMTDGAFEIAVYPIKQAWGFTDDNYRVPDQGTLDALLPLADSSLIKLDQDAGSVSFAKEGVEIDLGGIAKGYTSALIADIFRRHNVNGMINLGGNVQVYGPKPDGSDWRVAIRAPEGTDGEELPWLTNTSSVTEMLREVDYFGVLETHDQAVVTSGGYERYFEQDGKVYHHIIDPATGYPSDADLLSVTIVTQDGTLADGMATSMYVLGLDRAAELWQAHSDEFDMVLMDKDGNLYATEGIKDQFTSDLEIQWINVS